MLRLEIAGSWEPEDFIAFFTAVESIYYKSLLLHQERDMGPEWYGPGYMRFDLYASLDEECDHRNARIVTWARHIMPEGKRIYVRRVEYASPGGADFGGIGEATRAVEGIIDRLLKFFTERRLRRQRDEQESIRTERERIGLERDRESLRAMKSDNAWRAIERARKLSPAERDLLITLYARDQDMLIPLISQGQIVGIRDGSASSEDW